MATEPDTAPDHPVPTSPALTDEARDEIAHMRLLVDHVPSMLAYWDKDLRCRFANKAYKTWFGRTPEEMRGIPMQELLGPRLFGLNEPHIRGALRGEEQHFERIVPGPDGVQRHSMANYIPDIDNGVVKGFLVQVTEVTRLKAIEAALRASEAFLDRTGRIAGVGGWEVDLRTGLHKWSDQVCRIYGVPLGYRPTRDEAWQFVAPHAREAIMAEIARRRAQGQPWDVEVPITTATGRQALVRVLGEVEHVDGEPVRIFGAAQDITELRAREAELHQEQALRRRIEQQVEALDRLLQERGEMLDVLAHEVRQPLNNASAALQGAKSVLSSIGDQTAAQRVTRAQNVMNHVLANIDNTLAVASLLARPQPITLEDMDVDTLIGVAVTDMPHEARERIQVRRLTATRTVAMDMSLMRLALRNLLANALKFSTPLSEVTVTILDSDEPLALLIDVHNEGRGVDPDVLPHLFERGAHSSSHAGHGLGLYIVRRVMELHGGHVSLLENTAQGVTMRLTIIQTPGS